MVTVGY